MDKRIKRLWVKALRSGDYKQGNGRLQMYLNNMPDRYCCLGVLCDLAAKEGIVKSAVSNDLVRYGGGTNPFDYPEAYYLPIEVSEWSGVNREGRYGSAGRSLAVMNDEGKSFDEIADAIEKEL